MAPEMAEKPEIPDEKEAERRFNETLGRLVNTPHKPHKPKTGRPKLKMLAPRLKELPDRLQPAKRTTPKDSHDR